MNGILTTKEVAERLKVSVETVKRYLQRGKLKGYKPFGTKTGWRVLERDLEEFIFSRASAGVEGSSRSK